MVSSRIYFFCAFVALIASVSASGYTEPDYSHKPVCFKKIQKCCYKFEKCGYKFKVVADKKKCPKKVCENKCKKVPYTVKKEECKDVKVEVKCKDDHYGKKSYDAYAKKEPCYETKKECCDKFVTKYKDYCKKVCKIKYEYIKILKKFKYAKLCPKLKCEKVDVEYVKKPDVKISKDAIFVGSKGKCDKVHKPY